MVVHKLLLSYSFQLLIKSINNGICHLEGEILNTHTMMKFPQFKEILMEMGNSREMGNLHKMVKEIY